MKIMVFDIPAESGGALSILEEFYQEVNNYEDKSIEWVFVLSKPMLPETENITVLRVPWIKRSWLHRFYFDQFIAPKLVRKYQPDKIFSLQNVTVPRVNVEQITYVHQPLPFIDYKFSIKENTLFWIYQNIIGANIINSIKKAKLVIVQTQWMKNACLEKSQIKIDKIEVITPNICVGIKKVFEPNKKSLSTFFYPASGAEYKNHRIIVDACRKLKSLSSKDFEIIFTLNGNENPHITNLYKQIQEEKLPIRFEGLKTREEVFELYTKSILLFPSYIETFGLPLLESRLHKGIIIASDCSFSKDILNGYENAQFFNPFDANELVSLMVLSIEGKVNYKNTQNKSLNIYQKSKLVNTIVNN